MSVPASYTAPNVVADLTAAAAAGGGTDFRALVCVFLFGGNDHYNTVIPLTGANRQQYDFYRPDQTNVGIPIAQAPTNHLGADWRLHHNLGGLKTRWDAGDLGVVLNVGMLIEPTTRQAYQARSVRIAQQLFSHNSQQQQWQALEQFGLPILRGWFGRAANLAAGYFNPAPTDGLPPGFSVSGLQTLMRGYAGLRSSDMQEAGPSTIESFTAHSTTVESGGHAAAARIRSDYQNALQGYWADRMTSAIARQASLAAALQALPGTPNGRFDAVSGNSLAQQLRVVARVIHSRTQFAQRRQLFFVSIGGFDTHDSLRARHDALMSTVDEALNTFWLALGDLSMQDSVTTFTMSDFGRALIQNGRLGTDHGWGGHHFVMGGSVNGSIYGAPYDMTVDGPQDSGQGRSIPTLSCDQYAGELLRWWGIPSQHLRLVLPNLPNMLSTGIAGLMQ